MKPPPKRLSDLKGGTPPPGVYAPPTPKVIVAQPVARPVTRYIELTGNTQAINNVDLEANFSQSTGSISAAQSVILSSSPCDFGTDFIQGTVKGSNLNFRNYIIKKRQQRREPWLNRVQN